MITYMLTYVEFTLIKNPHSVSRGHECHLVRQLSPTTKYADCTDADLPCCHGFYSYCSLSKDQ